jgi:hypothetical protein
MRGTIRRAFWFAPAMLDQAIYPTAPECDPDIASYEVSEDGVTWRPYDPARDKDQPLHRRIEFAPPTGD